VHQSCKDISSPLFITTPGVFLARPKFVILVRGSGNALVTGAVRDHWDDHQKRQKGCLHSLHAFNSAMKVHVSQVTTLLCAVLPIGPPHGRDNNEVIWGWWYVPLTISSFHF